MIRLRPRPGAAATVIHPATIHTATIVVLVLAVYVLRLDQVAGLIIDDAWYMLLAKALAEGDGYRLINSAATEILPLYPPGFPAILSLVFTVAPEFPANIWLLKAVSIAAMGGAGVVTYRYFVGYRGVSPLLSLCLAIATVLTPAFVLLATSTLMSECVFTLCQLLAIVLVERAAREADDASGNRQAVLAGMMIGATLLIRTAGVSIAAAAALYLMHQRRMRRTAVFVAVAAACVLPWSLYSRGHAATPAQRAQHGGHIAQPYTEQFWTTVAGSALARPVGPADLPARIAENLANVLARDVGGIIIPTVFRTGPESGLEVFGLGPPSGMVMPSMGSARGTMLISLALSGVILAGFVLSWRERLTMAELLVPISLAITIVWPFWTFRFTLPLTPFLIFYLLVGVRGIASWGRRLTASATIDPLRVLRVTILALIGLNVWDHARYIVYAHDTDTPRIGLNNDAAEVEAVMEWLRRNVPEDAAIASDNPALVYLHTGRRTVTYDGPGGPGSWERWKRLGIKYIVCVLPKELPSPAIHDFKVRFKTPQLKLWVIEL